MTEIGWASGGAGRASRWSRTSASRRGCCGGRSTASRPRTGGWNLGGAFWYAWRDGAARGSRSARGVRALADLPVPVMTAYRALRRVLADARVLLADRLQ